VMVAAGGEPQDQHEPTHGDQGTAQRQSGPESRGS
jgi:hypothetical protein